MKAPKPGPCDAIFVGPHCSRGCHRRAGHAGMHESIDGTAWNDAAHAVPLSEAHHASIEALEKDVARLEDERDEAQTALTKLRIAVGRYVAATNRRNGPPTLMTASVARFFDEMADLAKGKSDG